MLNVWRLTRVTGSVLTGNERASTMGKNIS
jgi:hypothetical protein